jgi:hypothetical protein
MEYFKDCDFTIVGRDLEDNCQREDGICVFSFAITPTDL